MPRSTARPSIPSTRRGARRRKDPRICGGFPLRIGRWTVPVPGRRIVAVGQWTRKLRGGGLDVCAGCSEGLRRRAHVVAVWLANPRLGRRPKRVSVPVHKRCARYAKVGGTLGRWLVDAEPHVHSCRRVN